MITAQLTTKHKILIGLGAALVTAVLALALWYMLTHPVFTAALTDVSIILLAVVVLVMNVFLIVMLWQVIRLIDFLLFELKPVLESLQETSSTVRGTATFVGDGVTSPLIDASAKAAGLKGSLRFMVDSVLQGGQRAAGGRPGAAYQAAASPDGARAQGPTPDPARESGAAAGASNQFTA